MTDRCDVLVVGTGPCGSAVARRVLELGPTARVVLVDAGPELSAVPGESVRNLPADQRRAAYRLAGTAEVEPVPGQGDGIVARPGTRLVRPAVPGADPQRGMPAAAESTNVGGMGAHWTCFSPRPGASERIPFLPADELDAALTAGERALRVTTTAFPETPASLAVAEGLRRAYPDDGAARPPQPMPLACTPVPGGGLEWTGAATVLGPARGAAQLLPRTLCRAIDPAGAGVDVELEDLTTGARRTVGARAVVVAADALRTPQLLWASGIRPWALGRFLNDQPQLIAAAAVRQAGGRASGPAPTDAREAMTAVHWVPFAEDRPFHGILLQLEGSTVLSQDVAAPGLVMGMGWFTAKDLRAEDRVRFDSGEVDEHGLPRGVVDYDLTARDREAIAAAGAEMARVAGALGELLPGGDPLLLPAGASLHYQGSVRMGPADDGSSVCDPQGRVWGQPAVFVAGNGVIPTATACNPTLTSVALALRTGEAIAARLTG